LGEPGSKRKEKKKGRSIRARKKKKMTNTLSKKTRLYLKDMHKRDQF